MLRFLFPILLLTALFSQQQNIAVLSFSAKGVSVTEAEIITDTVRNNMVKLNKYNVLDRRNMENILAEQSLQQSGCTDASCALEIGKLLNMHYMVVGTVAKLGKLFTLNIEIVNIESGKIENSANKTTENIEDYLSQSIDIVSSLLKEDPSEFQQQSRNPLTITAISNNVIYGKINYFTRMKENYIYSVFNKSDYLGQGIVTDVNSSKFSMTFEGEEELSSKVKNRLYLKKTFLNRIRLNAIYPVMGIWTPVGDTPSEPLNKDHASINDYSFTATDYQNLPAPTGGAFLTVELLLKNNYFLGFNCGAAWQEVSRSLYKYEVTLSTNNEALKEFTRSTVVTVITPIFINRQFLSQNKLSFYAGAGLGIAYVAAYLYQHTDGSQENFEASSTTFNVIPGLQFGMKFLNSKRINLSVGYRLFYFQKDSLKLFIHHPIIGIAVRI